VEKVVSLESKNAVRGNMLLSYLNEPFLISEDESLPNYHTNYWECWQIANTFLDLGYNVDVINSYNNKFVPRKKYDILVGHRNQYEKIAKMLGEDCLKIHTLIQLTGFLIIMLRINVLLIYNKGKE
jgi:hypothetical protein